MSQKIPVYIITGFLGSGKTTVLKKILTHLHQTNKKPAVVLNEIGETNVEQDLFEKEKVLEMLSGCICCTIQEDFTNELQLFLTNIRGEEKPDVLLIEGTGVANPMEIIDALTNPTLINDLDLYSVISLIDGSKFLEYGSIFSSSKEVRTVLTSQVTISSLIVVNKTDLMTEKQRKKVLAKIEATKKEGVPVVEATYGEIDMQQLLERRVGIYRTELEKKKTCGCSTHHHDHSCENHQHDHHHTFQAIKFEIGKPINRPIFEKWLKQLPPTIVRGKGIVQLDETVGYFQFQIASGELKLARLKDKPTVEPCLILIGVGMNTSELISSFQRSVIDK